MKNARFPETRLSEFIGMDRDEASWEIFPGMTVSDQVSDDSTFSSGIIMMKREHIPTLEDTEELRLVIG